MIGQNPSLVESVKTASLVMGISATGTGTVENPVWTLVRPTFSEKSLLAACAVVKEEKGEGLVVDRAKEKGSARQ